MHRLRVICFLCFLFTTNVIAQCCMPGSPAGGSTNQGTMLPKDLRVIAFYQFSNGNHFFTGSKKQNYNYIEGAHFHFTGFSLAYGITPKLTAEMESGYFFNRTIRYSENGLKDNPHFHSKGLADIVLLTKYALYKNRAHGWEITPMFGIRIPSTFRPQMVEGEILNIDLQPSTQSVGLLGGMFIYKGLPNKKTHLFWNNRFVYSFPNSQQYQFGVSWNSALFVSHSFNHRFTIIGQLRNEWRQQDSKNDYFRDSTGSNVVLFAPQFNVSASQKWNFSAQVEIPVYHYYQGTQLARSVSAAIVVNRLFRF